MAGSLKDVQRRAIQQTTQIITSKTEDNWEQVKKTLKTLKFEDTQKNKVNGLGEVLAIGGTTKPHIEALNALLQQAEQARAQLIENELKQC